jgi:hypothetical protein
MRVITHDWKSVRAVPESLGLTGRNQPLVLQLLPVHIWGSPTGMRGTGCVFDWHKVTHMLEKDIPRRITQYHSFWAHGFFLVAYFFSLQVGRTERQAVILPKLAVAGRGFGPQRFRGASRAAYMEKARSNHSQPMICLRPAIACSQWWKTRFPIQQSNSRCVLGHSIGTAQRWYSAN